MTKRPSSSDPTREGSTTQNGGGGPTPRPDTKHDQSASGQARPPGIARDVATGAGESRSLAPGNGLNGGLRPLPRKTCPYMGMASDPETIHLQPSPTHRCHAVDPVLPIALGHQTAYCYGEFTACQYFVPLEDGKRAQAIETRNGAIIGADNAVDPARQPSGGTVATDASPASERSAHSRADAGTTAADHERTAAGNGRPTLPSKDGSSHASSDLAEPGYLENGAAETQTLWEHDTGARRAAARPGLADRVVRHFSGLTFEGWTLYTVGGTLLLIGAYFAFLGSKALGNTTPTPEPRMAARVAALMATDTPTATPLPTSTPKPTRSPDELPRETPPIPTPPAGGQVSALTPSEREVASVNSDDRLPEFGQRDLHVGQFNGDEYVGMISIPLSKISNATLVSEAQLELVGLSDLNLNVPGTWTVEMLPSQVDEQWSNLSYDLLQMAPDIQPPIKWEITSDDMRPGGVNTLKLEGPALEQLRARLDSDRPRVSFRIVGPTPSVEHKDKDNIFTWDTGYGEGFGTRPILRVAYVAPTSTPAPRPGAATTPTPLPLIIWDANPTPAPTTTPLPGAAPPVLSGMILFLSDRFEKTGLMVFDPSSGRTGRVTQSWVYAVAQRRDQAAAGLTAAPFSRPCGSAESGCTQIVVRRDSGEEAEITEAGWLHYDPAFTPAGDWLAYVSNVTGNDEIFKIRPDGSENTRLTENVWEWDKHPSFSPDGSQIVFWTNRDGRKQIYLMNADGSNQHNVSDSPYNDWDPVWVK